MTEKLNHKFYLTTLDPRGLNDSEELPEMYSTMYLNPKYPLWHLHRFAEQVGVSNGRFRCWGSSPFYILSDREYERAHEYGAHKLTDSPKSSHILYLIGNGWMRNLDYLNLKKNYGRIKYGN